MTKDLTDDERVARSRRSAAKELAKTGLLQIRIEPIIIERIYSVAAERSTRPSTLVRDWITEKLEQQDQKEEHSREALEEMQNTIDKLVTAVNNLTSMVETLGSRRRIEGPLKKMSYGQEDSSVKVRETELYED